MTDFGWRAGYAQLGTYRTGSGIGFVYAPWGDWEAPAPGTVNAWIAAGAPYTDVLMTLAYYPSVVNRFPARAAVAAGAGASWPAVEAAALIAAGVAVSA